MTAAHVPRLRVAFFGTPSRFSQLAFEQLTVSQTVVALVLPESAKANLRRSLRGLLGLRTVSPLEKIARDLGIPVMSVSDELGGASSERLHALQPELICIALFPRILPLEIIGIAPLGAVNVHPSLLPRHRGPLPLFWTYHSDDRVTGVTVHHADNRFDAGDVILQEGMNLPRAYPVAELDRDVAVRAAPLLRAAVEQLALGGASRVMQDERAATYAPLIRQGVSMVPFDQWQVERVHHFLAALCPRFREPLVDGNGRMILYDRVMEYRSGPTDRLPGSVEKCQHGWTLHCRDGVLLLGEGSH